MVRQFIGRHAELKKFEEALDGFTPHSQHIAFIYDAAEKQEDKGGIGKTQLLNEFLQIAQQPKYQRDFIVIDKIFDFYEPVNRDQISRLSRIVRPLEEKTGTKAFDRFWKNVSEYYSKNVSIERVMEEYWAGYKRMYADTGKTVIRFFDTFELAEKTLNYLKESYRFIENEILEISFIVISGRNKPKLEAPIWAGFADKIIHFPLQGFSNEEAKLYFINAGITDLQDHQIADLNRKAYGRPILLALMIDYLNTILKIEDLLQLAERDFKEKLVAFIKEFRNPPIDQAILAMAHLKHWCNKDFLQHFVDPKQNFEDNYQLLKSLSFVRRLGTQEEYVVLHDQMQEMVSDYILDKDYADGSLRREISEWAIDLYNQEIANHKKREEEYSRRHETGKYQVARDERFILKAEKWYHQLFVNRAQNIDDFFFELYDPSLERGYLDYCFILLSHLEDLSKLLPLSARTRNRIKIRAARLHAEKFYFTNNQYYRDEAGRLFDELLREAGKSGSKRFMSVVLCDYGALLFYLREMAEAERVLQDSIEALQQELIPGNYDVHYFLGKSQNWLGYILYQQGKFSDSIKILEEAEKSLSAADRLVLEDPELRGKDEFRTLRREQIDAWVAQVRGNLCRIYREVGDIKKAIYYGESSLKRRRQLGNLREIVKGLNSLGLVYSRNEQIARARELYDEAERHLQNVHDPILKGRIQTNKATLLFKRDKFSDLLAKHTLKTLKAAKNDLEFNVNDLNEARNLLIGVTKTLENTNLRELATTYHNLGELCLLEEEYVEAIDWFEKAVRVAKVENDAYTLLNSRQRLIQTAYLKQDAARFHKFKQEFEADKQKLKELEETARYVMRFYITVGDFYYDKLFKTATMAEYDQDFGSAFQAYTEAILYTRSYAPGRAAFAQEVFAERIFELLKSKPISQPLRAQLIQEWEKHRLDTSELKRYFDF